MKLIKRNGSEVDFDSDKIFYAVEKANEAIPEGERISAHQIEKIVARVTKKCTRLSRAVNVEEVQDMVEREIMELGAFTLAKTYITYRYTRALVRKNNTTDDKIISLIECNNEEVKQENSNKNPTVNSVQRDYIAGEVSKDLTRRLILPQDIVEAHDDGLIHFHDADYFAQHMHNCDLVNLGDMLERGTVISGTMIEKPHSFSTACNIATQIIAQVASNQYGGQSISLTHLAPFVDISRRKLRRLNTFLFQRISTWLANHCRYCCFISVDSLLYLRIFALCFGNLRNLQKYCQKGGALQCRRRCRGMVSAAFRSYSASGSGL